MLTTVLAESTHAGLETCKREYDGRNRRGATARQSVRSMTQDQNKIKIGSLEFCYSVALGNVQLYSFCIVSRTE